MVKLIFVLFLTLPIFLFSKNVHLEKGIDYCKKGNIDSALYHLNVIGDEVTIETSLEDIFNKNYYTAKCYDHIEANKSAEYYYLKAIAIMDSAEFSNTEIYLDLANFYQRIRNYISSNEYLKRYYEIEMGRLGQEAMTASENEKRIDSLETTITEMAINKKKLESDIRLLIVLITVFGLAFLVSLFLNIRNRNKTGKKS
jgi:tetratricopeptide (TPR) repeat protein